MAIFKCKMCGGNLEVESGTTVGTCDSCGTTMTLPKLGDDKRANLYDRANHFRRKNEYDKAADLYEMILNEDSTDAEAYWSLVLCKYGVEYVEDPKTHKRIPTCNRAQMTSILADEDYKGALKNADGMSREIYKAEAKIINTIQKGMLEISSMEAPFDIFICYKETDERGKRTPDSVLANDLYHQLTREGFKVFFSRITLEDKIGTAYEPYIFAALQSAKVMVVLGTKKENFESVWVRNEWSRYLALIKSDAGKTLVPAYKDMDPYDLPEEFSRLQALDMSKLGFMQDLIHGIKKLTGTQRAIPATPTSSDAVTIAAADAVARKEARIKEQEAQLEKLFKRLEPDMYESKEKAISVMKTINSFILECESPVRASAEFKIIPKIKAVIADLGARTFNGIVFDRKELADEARNELSKAKNLLTGLDYKQSEEDAIKAKKHLDGFETKFPATSEYMKNLKNQLDKSLADFDMKARTVMCGGEAVIFETREEALRRRTMPEVALLEKTYQKYLKTPLDESDNLLALMKNPDIGVKIHDAYAELVGRFNKEQKKTLEELKKIDVKLSKSQIVIILIGNIIGVIVMLFVPGWIFPDWLRWSWFGWKSVVECLIVGVPFGVLLLAGVDIDTKNDDIFIAPNPAIWLPMGLYWIMSGLIFWTQRVWMGKSTAGFLLFAGIGYMGSGLARRRELKKTKRFLNTINKDEDFLKPFDKR